MEANDWASALVKADMMKDQAYLEMLKKNAMSEIVILENVDLTSARLDTNPLEIGFPFQSVYIAGASDTSVSVNLILDNKDKYQGKIPLYLKDALNFPTKHSRAYLHWAAQSGKTITIVFFVSGNIKPGSQIVQVSSSVEANTLANVTPVSVLSTATALLAVDLNRKIATFQNDASEDVFIGASGVTIVNGIRVGPGDTVQYKNTAAIYGITTIGPASVRVQTES